MKKNLLLFIPCFAVFMMLQGQRYTNFRTSFLMLDTAHIKLDTLSIFPETFVLQGLTPSDYTLDPITATLTINNSAVMGRTISYSYRVFDIDFSKTSAHKYPDIILPKSTRRGTSLLPLTNSFAGMNLSFNDLETTGSISRDVSIGNNQDFVLNSSLNLQITGKLSEFWEISAHITDKNVPIQPEGNSRSINEFNRIFIQLKYKNLFLMNAGDIEIIKPHSYYLSVNRRVLGMEAIVQNPLGKISQLYNKVGGGMAKGKYVKQKIAAIEGIQGPYKLVGEQNEIAIVIIAGSERVYVDGILLLRGEENDYVIDYNSGELTFTAKMLVTTEKRIVAEFEYNNINFNHFTLYSFNEFKHDKSQKLKLNVNFFHEQDIKNQSIQPELDDAHKQFLSELGNKLTETYYYGEKSALYNGTEILYRKADTVVNGVTYRSVFSYSISPADTLYRLSFTYMGSGKGNYVLRSSAVNGRVFQWVKPIDSIPQGDYEPAILLKTPKLQEMGTIAAEYYFLKNSGIKGEFAFSNYNKNLFSKKNSSENLGAAFQVAVFHRNKLYTKKDRDTNWIFATQLSYEFDHKNFTPIESYREVEFSRRYNLEEDYSTKYATQMLYFQLGFLHNRMGATEYRLNYYNRIKNAKALRNELISDTRWRGFLFHIQASALISQDSIQKTQFVASDNLISKSFKKIEIGAKDLLEYNLFHETATGALRSNSYAFNEVAVYARNNDSMSYQYQITLKNRIDQGFYDNALAVNHVIYEAQVSWEMSQMKRNKVKGTASFRNNNIKDSSGNFKAENYFVGRIEYLGAYFKNSIRLSASYEAGSGLEPKKSFTYLKVAVGQGNFTWIDYNGNGIEELNEFEPARFQDEAHYIRVWIANNEYVNIYKNQLTISLQLLPRNIWNNAKRFRKFLSLFSNNVMLRSEQKNSLKNNINAFNPFHWNLKDEALVYNNVQCNNTFSFNLPSNYFGFDYTWQQTQNKNLLFYGVETNNATLHQLILKSTPHKSTVLTSNWQYGSKRIASNYFAANNYTLRYYTTDNSIQWQHKKVQSTLTYVFKNKQNRSGEEKSEQQNFSMNFGHRMAQKGTIQTTVTYIYIKYKGEANSNIGYEILEGLKPGNNMTWTAAFQYNLTQFLRLDLTYEGRVSENHRVIHVGALSLRAHF